MILALIIGSVISGLFPLLFLPVFRKMEQERLKAAGEGVATKLAALEDDVRAMGSHVRDLRETAANAAERAL